MISLLQEDIRLRETLKSEVSTEGIRGHRRRLMEFSKDMPYAVAGSPGEEAAFQYILELERMPLPYHDHSPDILLLMTKLKRHRNKAVDGFVLANDEIRRTLELLSDMRD